MEAVGSVRVSFRVGSCIPLGFCVRAVCLRVCSFYACMHPRVVDVLVYWRGSPTLLFSHRLLAANPAKSGFFAGDGLSVADLKAAGLLGWLTGG